MATPPAHMIRTFIFPFLCWQLLFAPGPCCRVLTHAAGGEWQLLLKNIGITAMHMQLLHNDRVVIFDRTDFGKSNLSLPDGKCRNDPNDTVLPIDCTAHSVEYDVATNSIRALMVQTDVWCSSGAVMANGNLIQTVASTTVTVWFGFSSRVLPATGKKFHLDWLRGDAILFDYAKNVVVKTFPTIPGGDPRCYPSTGSAVMLPLNLQASSIEVEVLVCGGAPTGSYTQASKGNFVGALKTCARIKITDSSPQWVMETMPLARVMAT
ncbi:Aldehyde oxidase GLOX1 [Vitis vinifera]|uniref:Aldehyde oxidase GLOX1 n=1 Tax=Vitis vinifera TaxID=29760 RepID=A0A438K256_VITVI|nr:Aldehyde oxidase GLOX1 [Vitis vinifera]